jgi:hypothetical protein
MDIKITKHSVTGEALVEISEEGVLVATVIPRHTEIGFSFTTVSKFAYDVLMENAYPPKVTICLERNDPKPGDDE